MTARDLILKWKVRRLKSFSILQTFTTQLCLLLKCGFPIIKILDLLSQGDDSFSDVCHKLTMDVFKGNSLSYAMALQPDIFPSYYIYVVRTGETSGRLAATFERLSRSLERQKRMRSVVSQALVYPSVLLLASTTLMLVGVYGIFPMIIEVTTTNESELPLLTRCLIVVASTRFLGLAITGVISLLSLVAILFLHPRTSTAVRHFWEGYTPFGHFFVNLRLTLCLRQLSLMYDSGIDLLRALQLLKDLCKGYLLLEEAFKALYSDVREGQSLHSCMTRHWVFPKFLTAMLAASEETATLGKTLDRTAEILEDDLLQTAQSLTKLIEPLMIGFLGVGVATIILATLMPVYSMVNQL